MKKSIALAVSSALLLTSCHSLNHKEPKSQQQLSTATSTNFSIPYVKYQLDNGLDVILHQDKSDPIVALATLFHVGSSREKPGKTGFAHFFEHMAFNNSENVPMGANRKMIGELGGSRNGGTWNDGTIYYEVVPKDAFEKLLWIDSDRFGYMINTVTEDALEREKQVVKNEKRQRVDNRAYGHTGGLINSHLYPKDHPYNWPVIGSLQDLQNATLDDVKEFYTEFYSPSNATLVIAGDIDIEESKKLVEKWFGEIKKGKEALPLKPQAASLKNNISLYHQDNFAKVPEIRLTFPTVEQYHPDSYALNALAEILSDGKSAPLYQRIVENLKLAPSVNAYNSSKELAGEFTIQVRSNAGVDLDKVYSAIEEALQDFEKNGFLDKELLKIKARQETQFYNGISSILNKAFSLASYNEYTGEPSNISKDIQAIKAVTKQDVLDVYARYIKGKNYIVTSFVPKGQPSLAVEGAKAANIVEEKIVQGAEVEVVVKDEQEFEKTPTSFPRTEPPLGKAPLLTPPAIWDSKLTNGLRVMGIEQNELPLVQFNLRIEGGHYLDDPKKSGTAKLLAELLMEGTKTKTAEQLADAIGLLGATININVGDEELVISANSLLSNYSQTLSLFEEILLEPRFDEKEFKRLKQRLLNRLKQRQGNAQAIAQNVAKKLLYTDEHILSIPAEGTMETVKNITLDDVKRFYRDNFSPSVSTFHVAGDIGQTRVKKSLSALAKRWKSKSVVIPEYNTQDMANTEAKLYFIDVPNAKQSVLLAGSLAFPGADENYNNLVYANRALGDGTSARLFQLLRIQKGYTYGAYSYISRREAMSSFLAQTSVRANVTKESLELLMKEIENYQATYTKQDLATTKNIVQKRQTSRFETLGSLLGLLNTISKYELDLDYLGQEQQELSALSLEDFQQTIEQYINPAKMTYLVVGDAKTQLKRLKDLGLGEPIQLDIKGNPIQ